MLGETRSILTPSRLVFNERAFIHENIPVVTQAIISIVERQRMSWKMPEHVTLCGLKDETVPGCKIQYLWASHLVLWKEMFKRISHLTFLKLISACIKKNLHTYINLDAVRTESVTRNRTGHESRSEQKKKRLYQKGSLPAGETYPSGRDIENKGEAMPEHSESSSRGPGLRCPRACSWGSDICEWPDNELECVLAGIFYRYNRRFYCDT